MPKRSGRLTIVSAPNYDPDMPAQKIRDALVGIEVPYNRVSHKGFYIPRTDLVEALAEASKEEAAAFFQGATYKYVIIATNVCRQHGEGGDLGCQPSPTRGKRKPYSCISCGARYATDRNRCDICNSYLIEYDP